MNERQEIAYLKPFCHGPEMFSRIYHKDIELGDLLLRTTLTVSCFSARPVASPSWSAAASVLSPTMQPIDTGKRFADQKQKVWNVLDSLLKGVGCGDTEKVEAGNMFLASRKLSAAERRGLTVNSSASGEEIARIGLKVR